MLDLGKADHRPFIGKVIVFLGGLTMDLTSLHVFSASSRILRKSVYAAIRPVAKLLARSMRVSCIGQGNGGRVQCRQ